MERTENVRLTLNELLILYGEIDGRCLASEEAGFENPTSIGIRDKISAAIIKLKSPQTESMKMAVVRSITVELFSPDDGGGAVATGQTIEVNDHPLIGKFVHVQGNRIVNQEC